jgi:diacylglycerol kinase (ATP)
MKRAGVIVNPKAGRGSGKGLALAERLSRNRALPIAVLRDFRELESILINFARADIEEIYISSGDGTIQAIQTYIAEGRMFRTLPRLCLLPHGTTNMTAADLGFRHKSVEAQAIYIEGHSREDLRSRPTLRAVNPGDGPARHGMFLGAGAVADATLYCQRAFNDKGIKGSWATFAVLGGAALKTAFSAPDPTDANRFDRPYPITITKGSGQVCSGFQLLALCSTLDKLILGARPFWGGKHGPIRVSVFPYPVPSVPRWMFSVLYGSENRKAPAGARSFSTDRFEIETPALYVLDGEFFEGPAQGPLKIESGPIFTYICG